MGFVYMNGEFVPGSEALIPVGDRGVLYGDGLFETVRAYRGRPFRLDRHLERLEEGCRVLRIRPSATFGKIPDAVTSLITRNGLEKEDDRVRVTLTGGPSEGPKGLERPGPSVVFIQASRYSGLPDEAYRTGIDIVISGIKRNTTSRLSHTKSANYLDSLLARQEAYDRGADDAVMLSSAGNLAEATSSNLFMVSDDELLTPDIGCGFLPGITREAIIELCGKLGIRCTPVMKGPEVLLSADEAFLTNSMTEVVPLRTVAGKQLGKKCPGPVTERLARAYKELVSEELGM